VDKNGRVLRFTLKPAKHQGAQSAELALYVVVLKGQGMFSGGDGQEKSFGSNSLLVFDPGENHMIRAVEEELVFVGFLRGVPGTREKKVGGEMARKRK